MKEFYSLLPGLEMIQENFFPDGNLRSVWYRCNGNNSVLMLEKENFSSAPYALVFSVSSTGMEKDRLRELLFQGLGLQQDSESEYTIYFRDPDGNRLGYSDYDFKSK